LIGQVQSGSLKALAVTGKPSATNLVCLATHVVNQCRKCSELLMIQRGLVRSSMAVATNIPLNQSQQLGFPTNVRFWG
jgi:hypothetical protein